IDSSLWFPTGHVVSHASFRFFAFDVLICLSVENRVFPMSAPPCGKSFPAGPSVPVTPVGSQGYGASASLAPDAVRDADARATAVAATRPVATASMSNLRICLPSGLEGEEAATRPA